MKASLSKAIQEMKLHDTVKNVLFESKLCDASSIVPMLKPSYDWMRAGLSNT